MDDQTVRAQSFLKTRDWERLPGMRHAEFCDAHGRRLVVEAARWHSPPFDHHHEEWLGFIGGVRVGTWPDLEQAKAATLAIADERVGLDY